MKKLKRIKKFLLVVLLIIIIIFIALLFLLPRKGNDLIGTWTTDDVTVYQFNKGGTGALIVPLGTYDFTYKTEKDKLSIDFESEESIDYEYKYYFKDDKLILEGTNGKFTFKKKKQKD